MTSSSGPRWEETLDAARQAEAGERYDEAAALESRAALLRDYARLLREVGRGAAPAGGGRAMRFAVRTVEEGRAALEYFNAFHDGFVKSLSIRSHDVFERRGVQTCLGMPDVELVIAHYNYQQDTRPHDQLVRVALHGVTDLAVLFSGMPYEWSIKYVSIGAATRCLAGENLARAQEGAGAAEFTPCLEFILVQSRLTASRGWEPHEDVRLRFDHAELEELPSREARL